MFVLISHLFCHATTPIEGEELASLLLIANLQAPRHCLHSAPQRSAAQDRIQTWLIVPGHGATGLYHLQLLQFVKHIRAQVLERNAVVLLFWHIPAPLGLRSAKKALLEVVRGPGKRALGIVEPQEIPGAGLSRSRGRVLRVVCVRACVRACVCVCVRACVCVCVCDLYF